MHHDHVSHPRLSTTLLTHPCAHACATPTKVRRSRRRVRTHLAVSPAVTDNGVGAVHSTPAQRLVLVQEGKVICVVEHHRNDSARSVARLLCRLMLSDACVYGCPATEADHLHLEQRLDGVPEHWQELYRATPWAEPTVAETVSLPVLVIR